MFTELAPLLADRTLLLTLSSVPGGAIRVNVIPKCRNGNDAAEKALATPLSVTGTAVELDRELPAQVSKECLQVYDLEPFTHKLLSILAQENLADFTVNGGSPECPLKVAALS
jgi:PRTRC genetic system protein E